MKQKKLDSFDKALIGLLSEDGRMPIGQLAKQLNVTSPTVRSRLQSLIRSGMIKINCLIDSFYTEEITTALVGINVEIHEQLDEKISQIADLDQVHWAAVVTGRYDIIVEVVLHDGAKDLYRFITEDLPRVGRISSSESFVVMKAKKKLITLPPAMRKW